jgi:hypothetical protein
MQLVGHQDSVGEPAVFVPVIGDAESREEVGSDNGSLVLAKKGLQLLGVMAMPFILLSAGSTSSAT